MFIKDSVDNLYIKSVSLEPRFRINFTDRYKEAWKFDELSTGTNILNLIKYNYPETLDNKRKGRKYYHRFKCIAIHKNQEIIVNYLT